MTNELVHEIDRLRRAGFDTRPKAPLFPNLHGTPISRQRVAEILTEAATLADERLQARGLRPLAHITPHTMRRTYISIALIANEFDVKWMQDQVGHSDSKMTLDVYAQLQQRAKREHGTRFDKLMREGRASLYRNGAEPGKDPERGVWDGEWDGKPQNRPSTLISRQRGDHQNGSNAGHSRRPNTPFGRGTPRFSAVAPADRPALRIVAKSPSLQAFSIVCRVAGRSRSLPRYPKLPADTWGFVPRMGSGGTNLQAPILLGAIRPLCAQFLIEMCRFAGILWTTCRHQDRRAYTRIVGHYRGVRHFSL